MVRAAILGACDARPAALLYPRPPSRPVAVSKDPHSPIADRPASEMSLETNILHHLASCLERKPGLALGDITMTSPTQNEEADLGFDAVVGQPDGRYVVLQFKRPNPLRSTLLSFRIPAKQVQALLWRPRGSAFFVLPAVKTNRDLWDTGASLLDMTRIVDVWDLYAPFDKIGLLDPGRREYSESAGRAVRIAKDDGSTKINVTKRHGWVGRGLHSIPISCLCSMGGAGGIVVKNGVAKTWRGRKWDKSEWQHEAEGVWRGPGERDVGDSGHEARHEGLPKTEISRMAEIVWASQGDGEEALNDSQRGAGHAYLLRISGPGSAKSERSVGGGQARPNSMQA